MSLGSALNGFDPCAGDVGKFFCDIGEGVDDLVKVI